MSFKKTLRRLEHLILHKTIFRSRAGDVDFYGLQDDDAPEEIDGQVIVFDKRTGQRAAYRFHFDNRYMTYRPIGNRVLAVFQALYAIDGIRPLGVVENGQMYTPFGHYDSIPKTMRDVLQVA